MLKLNIGCGLNYKSGYVNIDSYDNTVADEIMSTQDLRYENSSVDLIESYQLIEHLGYMNTILTIGECFRVLKNKSSIMIEASDIDKTFEIYLKNTNHSQKAVILNWIFGTLAKGYEHKFCFPAGMLRKLLIESGFVDVMERYHEKTFGAPSYTFIAKKPITTNPIYYLVHNLRKRCFKEIETFKGDDGLSYQINFEKNVLGHTIDYSPRDFSNYTFNEIFINCTTYSLQVANILVEECLNLNVIDDILYNKIINRLTILKEHNFIDFLYYNFEQNLYNYNDPERASLLSIEIGRNIAKFILFDLNDTEFKNNINNNIPKMNHKPLIRETFFSTLYIETIVSQMLAKVIKGTASDAEKKLCKTFTIEEQSV